MTAADLSVGRAGAWRKAHGFVGYQGQWVPIGGAGGDLLGVIGHAGITSYMGRGIMMQANATNRSQCWGRIGNRWCHLNGTTMRSWSPDDGTTAWRTEPSPSIGQSNADIQFVHPDGDRFVACGFSAVQSWRPGVGWANDGSVPPSASSWGSDQTVRFMGDRVIASVHGATSTLRTWRPGESAWTTIPLNAGTSQVHGWAVTGSRLWVMGQHGFPAHRIEYTDDLGSTWHVHTTGVPAGGTPAGQLIAARGRLYHVAPSGVTPSAGIAAGLNMLTDAGTWMALEGPGMVSSNNHRHFVDADGVPWLTFADTNITQTWAVPMGLPS